MRAKWSLQPRPKPKKAKAAPKAKTKAAPKDTPKALSKAPSKDALAPVATSSGDGSDPDFFQKRTVIITGTIPGHERKSAHQILENAGAQIAKSLNKQIDFVILGIKPGPDKLEKIKHLGVETIAWSEVADKLGLELAPEKKAAEIKAGDAPDSIDGMTILITGEIDGFVRSSAQKLLEAEGAKFAKSLTKAVELVVLGTNAGTEKLAQIKEKDIPTCEWTVLVEKLGIGEAAGQPPKKKAKKNR